MRMGTYGHRRPSLFFHPVVEVYDEGFRFANVDYSWDAVRNVEVSDSPWNFLAGYPAAIPRATVHLKDGKRIRLNGRVLEKVGTRPKIGFFSSKSDAFQALVAVFKAHEA